MAGVDLRVDPADGGVYSYEQVFALWNGQYSPQEIGVYWQFYMAPVNFFMKGKGKNSGRGQPNMTTVRQSQKQEPQDTERELGELRERLRFGLNDRLLCNLGPRWLSGVVVGTAVPDPEEEGEILPYLVKTDPLPGLPGRTISVPCDEEDTCTLEVCFDPASSLQLGLIKAAAAVLKEGSKPKLRFAVGESVVCRINNDPKDGLERWVPGMIDKLWPILPGEKTWDMFGVSGEYADSVPYEVALTSGRRVFCHRDDYTLIRREGLQPQTRVKGISKRMEVRSNEDGSKETIDHVTERRKVVIAESDSD